MAVKEFKEDPKPSELPMSRVNPTEMRGEARTRTCCKKLG